MTLVVLHGFPPKMTLHLKTSFIEKHVFDNVLDLCSQGGLTPMAHGGGA